MLQMPSCPDHASRQSFGPFSVPGPTVQRAQSLIASNKKNQLTGTTPNSVVTWGFGQNRGLGTHFLERARIMFLQETSPWKFSVPVLPVCISAQGEQGSKKNVVRALEADRKIKGGGGGMSLKWLIAATMQDCLSRFTVASNNELCVECTAAHVP